MLLPMVAQRWLLVLSAELAPVAKSDGDGFAQI
jgi:hypothetical protein